MEHAHNLLLYLRLLPPNIIPETFSLDSKKFFHLPR